MESDKTARNISHTKWRQQTANQIFNIIRCILILSMVKSDCMASILRLSADATVMIKYLHYIKCKDKRRTCIKKKVTTPWFCESILHLAWNCPTVTCRTALRKNASNLIFPSIESFERRVLLPQRSTSIYRRLDLRFVHRPTDRGRTGIAPFKSVYASINGIDDDVDQRRIVRTRCRRSVDWFRAATTGRCLVWVSVPATFTAPRWPSERSSDHPRGWQCVWYTLLSRHCNIDDAVER